jgi:nucleoside-diphosphate-sugar epimerase
MKLLVLGGTAFLGREVARRALAAGHEVTCAARGNAGAAPDGAAFVTLDRDAPDGLAALGEDAWDAVIDVSRQPGQVRRAVTALRDRVLHAVFVSTGNVYADTTTRRLSESGALLDPLETDVMTGMEDYGRAKVACEQAVLQAFGPRRATIARSGLIGGPGDVTGRTGYWPWRMAHPSTSDGRVLVPDAFDDPVQVIDVTDLADWLVHCAAERVSGVFNAVGDPLTFGDMLQISQGASGVERQLVAAAPGWLREHGVEPWMGARSLPLWIGDPAWLGFSDRDNTVAKHAGLRLRPYPELFGRALEYERARPSTTPRACGLTDEDERELLAALIAPRADQDGPPRGPRGTRPAG